MKAGFGVKYCEDDHNMYGPEYKEKFKKKDGSVAKIKYTLQEYQEKFANHSNFKQRLNFMNVFDPSHEDHD